MTELVTHELKIAGLNLNAKKTKILHTHDANEFNDVDFVDINGDMVEVLHDDAHHRYLGRFLSLSAESRIECEFRHRIN